MCQMFSVYVLSKTVFTFIWLLRWVVTSRVLQPSVPRWGAVVQGRQEVKIMLLLGNPLKYTLNLFTWLGDWVYVNSNYYKFRPNSKKSPSPLPGAGTWGHGAIWGMACHLTCISIFTAAIHHSSYLRPHTDLASAAVLSPVERTSSFIPPLSGRRSISDIRISALSRNSGHLLRRCWLTEWTATATQQIFNFSDF